DNKRDASKIAKAEGDYATASAQKSEVEQKLSQMTLDRDAKADEIKGQAQRLASNDADLKKLMSVAEANGTVIATLMEKYNQAFQQVTGDGKPRDDAVRAKDTAEAENRELKAKVAALNGTVTDKDLAIAGLTKDKSELQLLVDVATARGF